MLDDTERQVHLEVEGAPGTEIEHLIDRLRERGFDVHVRKDANVHEPQLVTDVGGFIGPKSIAGFVDNYQRIFDIAHQNAQELSRV
jgi:hypothetical protein